jgi:hypothetical protein
VTVKPKYGVPMILECLWLLDHVVGEFVIIDTIIDNQ